MEDGLKDKHRQAILDALISNKKVERAVLFGSRAMGTFTPQSDVDIALFGKGLTLDDLAGLKRQMEELAVPQVVDLLIHDDIKAPKLREHIRRHGVELFSRAVEMDDGASGGRAMWSDLAQNAPKNWRKRPIEDVCLRVTSGGTPSRANKKFYINGKWPWVKTQELLDCWLEDTEEHITDEAIERSSAKVLPEQTVLLALYGATVGRLGILRNSMTCNQACCAMIVNEPEAHFRYLYYALLASRAQLKGLASGAAQQNLSGQLIKEFVLPFPDISVQQSIAHLLGTLDDKVELNCRMNRTLEKMAAAIFKSWFIDFEPVRAKAEGRDTGLPVEISDLFPDSFEDSELGEIPRGWRIGMLEEILIELETGGRPKGGVSQYKYGIPSIGAESIVGLGQFDYSKTKFVPKEFFLSMNKGRVRSRDVCLYKDGGRPGQFEPHVTLFGDGFPFSVCAINEHVYRMQAKQDFGQNLLFFWLSSDFVMDEMRNKGTGVAIPGLNSTQVKSLTTLIPGNKIAKAFDMFVDPYITRILMNCCQSRTLARQRDLLLHKLLSGELEAPAIESVEEGAA